LLALACSLPLLPTGASASDPPVVMTLGLGAPMEPFCFAHIGCAPFADGPPVVGHPAGCQNAEVHNKSPFTTIADIYEHTKDGARRVEFKLEASEGFGSVRQLVVSMRDQNCGDPPQTDPDVQWRLGVGEKVTFTIPRRTKWFIVYGRDGTPSIIHHNERWRLSFLH
jgi:hypothetical protein